MKPLSEAIQNNMKTIRKRFRANYDGSDGWPGIDCGESLTKQSFTDECDINKIMRRAEQTGELPNMIKTDPQYGDFSDVGSYQEACNVVIRAQEQFAALNAHIRSRFANDPAQFLEFATNPANAAELIKMGLATQRVENAQPVQSAVPPSPASSGPKGGDPAAKQ